MSPNWSLEVATALLKRAISSLTSPSVIALLETEMRVLSMTKALPIATPGETPMPLYTFIPGPSSLLVELVHYQGGDGVYCLLLVRAVRPHYHQAALRRGEHHEAHDALAVDLH